MAVILIPRMWASETGGSERIVFEVGTVGQAVVELLARFPGLERWLDNGTGAIPLYTHIFLGNRDIRILEGIATSATTQDEIKFIVDMSGG
jgi:molybdopterin converting factor small subunit